MRSDIISFESVCTNSFVVFRTCSSFLQINICICRYSIRDTSWIIDFRGDIMGYCHVLEALCQSDTSTNFFLLYASYNLLSTNYAAWNSQSLTDFLVAYKDEKHWAHSKWQYTSPKTLFFLLTCDLSLHSSIEQNHIYGCYSILCTYFRILSWYHQRGWTFPLCFQMF